MLIEVNCQFLQRGRALSLWRTIVRGCRRISDPSTKDETLRFAKDEFRRNKEVKDIVGSSYLAFGLQWKKWRRGIDVQEWKLMMVFNRVRSGT